MFPYAHSIASFAPASSSLQDPATGSLPPKRPRKRQDTYGVAHNFHRGLGATMVPVSTVPVARLIAMLDCDHAAGSKYGVVSKPVTSGHYVTTVLDVLLRRIYRATHATGMATFWRGLAARNAAHVDYVAALQRYDPANYQLPGPKKKPNFAAEAYRVAVAERAAFDAKHGPIKRVTPRKMPPTSC